MIGHPVKVLAAWGRGPKTYQAGATGPKLGLAK
jgi:hypothetical protein